MEHDDGAGRGSAGPGRLAARPQHRPRHPAQWGRLSHQGSGHILENVQKSVLFPPKRGKFLPD